MIGTKIQATTNIIFRVISLDVASHTVKLAIGIVVLGIRNGNIENPAVKITPAIMAELDTNAHPARPAFEKAAHARPPAIPSTGAIIIQG